jgi:hypothetical protein
MGSVRVSGTPDEYPDAGLAEWLEHPKRARWHLHFTPTSSSWLRHGRFDSVAALTGRAALTHQTKSATHH